MRKPVTRRDDVEIGERETLLEVRDLRIGFHDRSSVSAGAATMAVRGVSFMVHRGEILALVGESGSGKTVTALSILGLLPPEGRIHAGSIRLRGAGDLVGLDERGLRRLRGRRIAAIFQDPMSALNPVLTIGYQIVEVLRAHRDLRRRRARQEAVSLLELVAMPDPARRLDSYPHQLSGGQLQRAMIAMALACRPDLLIADEPTTALDVTIQAQILDLLADLRQRLGVAILLITHDLGVVAEIADRVAVLYAGQLVEQAPVGELYRRPGHPYTRHLLAAVSGAVESGPSEDGLSGVQRAGGEPETSRRIAAGVPDCGCAFEPRCMHRLLRCSRDDPPWAAVAGSASQTVRCFLHGDEESAQ